ncbi:unnamed protein product [Ambrosiozyma monospora]|uniref:Unnamed protein product n=1 Tax=Ambrosiozyma monospora TaxID=43982 RepID=A0ACB5UBG9_AMBMO|nr:unnamed protein product [Ambrosiozyma monospora]
MSFNRSGYFINPLQEHEIQPQVIHQEIPLSLPSFPQQQVQSLNNRARNRLSMVSQHLQAPNRPAQYPYCSQDERDWYFQRTTGLGMNQPQLVDLMTRGGSKTN